MYKHIQNENGTWKQVPLDEAEIALESTKDVNSVKSEALRLLASTDWLTAKYHDVITIGGGNKSAFLTKYTELYAMREAARATINA